MSGDVSFDRSYHSTFDAMQAELDRLRMQLAACGIVAMANTPESSIRARDVHPDYRSASCDEVAKAVDREMELRAQVEKLKEDAKRYQWIKEHVKEAPLDLFRYSGEFPDTRLKYELPTLVSWADYCGQISFDDAIDAAMEKRP